MSYICGNILAPIFNIKKIADNSDVDILRFPEAAIEGIALESNRTMLIKNNYGGTTDVEDKGYIVNWTIDYKERFSAEDIFNLFKPFQFYATNSGIYKILFNPTSNGSDIYDVLCINKSFKLTPKYNGKDIIYYEGLEILLQSRNRIKDFTSQWQLIDPSKTPVQAIDTGEPFITN